MASLKDIARQTGLSTTTVSFILSGKAEQYRIADSSVRTVTAAAKRLGYEPNQLARSLRTRTTNTIGLVVADITTAFFSQLARHVQTVADSKGCHVIVANTADDPQRERDAVRTLLARSVDGLIVSSVMRTPAAASHSGRAVPVVYIDRKLDGPGAYCVTTDNRYGMHELTEQLLGRGARRIAFIGGLKHLSTHTERLAGFLDAHEDRGVTPDRALIVSGAFTVESGCSLALRMMRSRRPPDAVITAALPLFEGVMRALGQLRFDAALLHLATFDDHPLLDYLRVPVCSVRQDCEAMARAAVGGLLSLARGATPAPVTSIRPLLITRPREESK